MGYFGLSRMSIFVTGAEIAPKNFIINRELLVAYANASGDQNPIHQNEAFAQSVGLENVIAHGMLTMALVGRYVSEIAGSGAVKEFAARFVKPVVVPASTDVELLVSAKVLAIESNEMKIEITASCKGVKVLSMAKAVIAIR